MAGALLVVSVDLADEVVHVNDQTLVTRAGAGRPRTTQRLGERPIELTGHARR
jgi:hypothetical protein